MGQHFKLTSREFYDNARLFKVLEIKAEQVIDKGYKDLSSVLKTQYRKLILVDHPDKGGDRDRFEQIYQAYQELEKYIEPLKLGNPCVKVGVNAESDGRLTAREFHYRKKLFDTLGIGEEAIGRDFNKLISMLKKNDSSFYMFHNPKKYNEYLSKPSMRLFLYISPLQQKKNLIEEDKKALALKFIERKNVILPRIQIYSPLFLGLLTTVTIGCYFSWWIIAFNIITNKAFGMLINYYVKKYANEEISTDEFMSKMNYIVLGSKLFFCLSSSCFFYLFSYNKFHC